MATRSLGTLTVDLIARTGGFEQGMDRAARTARQKSQEIEQQSRKSSLAVQQVWEVAAGAVQGAFAAFSVGAVFGKFVQETINAQNEQAQLAAVVKSTGQAAGYSVQQLNDMADAMEHVTSFSAGDINQAQTTLLAFTGIAGEQFPKALQASADMAARTGMMVKSAAETIGRALDIPSEGLSALSRQGFRFTDDQKKLVEQLESTGRTAEAQGIILKALEESYGGAAAAARDTLGGSLAALQNTISSLLTGSDDGVRGMTDAINGLSDALGSDGARGAVETFGKSIEVVGVVLAARLATPVIAAGVYMSAFTARAIAASVGLASVSTALEVAATRMAAMAAVSRVASSALALVGGPLGAVILAVGGAAYAWREYSSSSRDAASSSAKDVADIKGGVDGLVESYQKLNELQRQQVIGIKTEDLSAAIRSAQSALEDLGDAFQPSLAQGTKAAAQFRVDFTREVKQVATDTALSSNEMATSISSLIDSYIQSGRASEGSRSRLTDLAQAVVESSSHASQLSKDLDVLVEAQRSLTSSASAAADAQSQVAEAITRTSKAGASYLENLQRQAVVAGKLTESAKLDAQVNAGLFTLSDVDLKKAREYAKAIDAAEKAKKGLKDASSKANNEIVAMVKSLQVQQGTLGMTEEAAGRYRIEVATGSDALRKKALAIYDEIAAHKNLQKAIQQTIYIQSVQRELDVFQQQQNVEIAGIGMGDRQREQLERELAIRQDYAERRRQLEEAQQVESTRLAQEQYEARIRALQEAEDRQLGIVQDAALRRAEAEGSWVNGMNRSLQNYVDNASNVSQQVDDLFTNAFRNAEDALVGFIKTGELDLQNLVQGIGEELVRMLVRIGLQMVANAILGQTMAAASTAMAVATGTAMAAAYAPAAAFASLASFGANAAPAAAGLVSTVGIAQGLAFAGMFDEGGVIPAGKWGIAGELGPEIIQGPAHVTSRLDTANLLSGQKNSGVTVNLIEDESRAGTVETTTNEDREDIINIFVADIRSGGRASQAIEQTYRMRRVGA